MVATGKKSACNDAARRAQQAAILAMSPIERVELALEVGETTEIFARLGAESRDRKREQANRRSR